MRRRAERVQKGPEMRDQGWMHRTQPHACSGSRLTCDVCRRSLLRGRSSFTDSRSSVQQIDDGRGPRAETRRDPGRRSPIGAEMSRERCRGYAYLAAEVRNWTSFGSADASQLRPRWIRPLPGAVPLGTARCTGARRRHNLRKALTRDSWLRPAPESGIVVSGESRRSQRFPATLVRTLRHSSTVSRNRSNWPAVDRRGGLGSGSL